MQLLCIVPAHGPFPGDMDGVLVAEVGCGWRLPLIYPTFPPASRVPRDADRSGRTTCNLNSPHSTSYCLTWLEHCCVLCLVVISPFGCSMEVAATVSSLSFLAVGTFGRQPRGMGALLLHTGSNPFPPYCGAGGSRMPQIVSKHCSRWLVWFSFGPCLPLQPPARACGPPSAYMMQSAPKR